MPPASMVLRPRHRLYVIAALLTAVAVLVFTRVLASGYPLARPPIADFDRRRCARSHRPKGGRGGISGQRRRSAPLPLQTCSPGAGVRSSTCRSLWNESSCSRCPSTPSSSATGANGPSPCSVSTGVFGRTLGEFRFSGAGDTSPVLNGRLLRKCRTSRFPRLEAVCRREISRPSATGGLADAMSISCRCSGLSRSARGEHRAVRGHPPHSLLFGKQAHRRTSKDAAGAAFYRGPKKLDAGADRSSAAPPRPFLLATFHRWRRRSAIMPRACAARSAFRPIVSTNRPALPLDSAAFFSASPQPDRAQGQNQPGLAAPSPTLPPISASSAAFSVCGLTSCLTRSTPWSCGCRRTTPSPPPNATFLVFFVSRSAEHDLVGPQKGHLLDSLVLGRRRSSSIH